jgi:hypothetical protein
VWRTPRKGESRERWINPCPADHYDAMDTRHAPLVGEAYAGGLSESTSKHTMEFMRDLATLPKREERESMVQCMWSTMGPVGTADGQARALEDEELRLMTVMLCQGDWPPEMVAGAERHQW